MTQTKKRLLVILTLVLGLIFYQPFTVRAEDQVSTAMTFDDDAVFYLADESMSTIYKCTISGFYESSPVEDEATGSWVVKKQKKIFHKWRKKL